MLPKTHIALGFIFAGLLFFFFPEINLASALIIWLSSFLIDADHYIFYVFVEGDFSLKNAYNWHLMKREKLRKLSKKEKRKHRSEILFLHGIEPILVLYFLSMFETLHFLVFAAIGFGFHMFLDVLEEIAFMGRSNKISLIYCIFAYRKLNKLKLDDLEILKI